MIERVLNDFDIDQIANSGQCFRFHRVGDKSYDLIAGTHLLNIQQNGQTVRFDCDENEFNTIWQPYFDLDADYSRYKAAVAKRDTYLQNAVAYGGGLRILRQDLWETILCFIISQQNNIARITRCVENLCSLFGETCYNKSEQVYNSIPTAERLAACTPEDLAPVRLPKASAATRPGLHPAAGERRARVALLIGERRSRWRGTGPVPGDSLRVSER